MINLEPILASLADMVADRLRNGLPGQSRRQQPTLLSVPAVAERLGRTPMSVRHLIAQGKLPSVRCDRRVFVDSTDVDQFIDCNKRRN